MNHRLAFLALTALLTLPLLAATGDVAAKPAKPLHISKGQPVTLTDYVVPGKTTVFDFYSDYCGPCVQMSPSLEKLHSQRADVVVVKVDINRPGQKGIDWKSPVVQQYKLQSIPHFKVYGPDGKLLAEDAPGNAKARQIVTGMMK
jgi:thiol-disulfide isomerase/thioredoxin